MSPVQNDKNGSVDSQDSSRAEPHKVSALVKLAGIGGGALGWYACKSGYVPAPPSSSGQGLLFQYNLASGWYVMAGTIVAGVLILLLEQLIRGRPVRRHAYEALQATSVAGALFLLAYAVLVIPVYFLPYTVAEVLDEGPLNAHNVAFGMYALLTVALACLCWRRGGMIGRRWIVLLPIVAGTVDLSQYIGFLHTYVPWVPFLPTVAHLVAALTGTQGHVGRRDG